jgi:hypothetical protein
MKTLISSYNLPRRRDGNYWIWPAFAFMAFPNQSVPAAAWLNQSLLGLGFRPLWHYCSTPGAYFSGILKPRTNHSAVT